MVKWKKIWTGRSFVRNSVRSNVRSKITASQIAHKIVGGLTITHIEKHVLDFKFTPCTLNSVNCIIHMYWFDNFPKIFRFRYWIFQKVRKIFISQEMIEFSVTIPQTIHHVSMWVMVNDIQRHKNATKTPPKTLVNR